MSHIEACLIDAYGTVVQDDFTGRWIAAADLAGIPAGKWGRARSHMAPDVTVGHLTIAEAIELTLRVCGVTPEPALVAKLATMDRDILRSSARLYDDVIPLLTLLRERGIRTAIVSNCGDNTRPMLTSVGLADLTDEFVLSCEVGYAKPSAPIYQAALDRLGVAAERALFVDDQPVFCAGAERLGITAVRIARDGADGDWATVDIGSLLDIERML
jgi:HAD superfamily hydrolase (TIGR01509 family)